MAAGDTLGRQTREHGPALPPSARGGLKREETPPPGRGRRTEQLRNRTHKRPRRTRRDGSLLDHGQQGASGRHRRAACSGPVSVPGAGCGQGLDSPCPAASEHQGDGVPGQHPRQAGEVRVPVRGLLEEPLVHLHLGRRTGLGSAPHLPLCPERGLSDPPCHTSEGPRAAPKGHEAQTSAESPQPQTRSGHRPRSPMQLSGRVHRAAGKGRL